ncbi:sugar phosphate isomerase/epimerase [Streptomyces sp. NBC_00365]|uniref:sugar phosphate isomerase/epimerase family protein n=1 Tax=Streptomyces sp. NBC_00365 TaxID=2975726 RepID=UPI0022594EFC|nr:sugar phosphate isomerase/epimerase [Streptomyces sp. NBC_00365]MCX5095813.1 sugar phosphate isomerase/epimerase [Streptomyces sp. NBC_00365]
MSSPRFAGGMWSFGRIIDRYATNGYGPEVGALEAIDLAAQSGELTTLDLNYPFGDRVSIADVKATLAKHDLAVTNITPVIYDRGYRSGSFTSADPELRRAAVDLGHESVAVARELGARYVKFWPGQDGYDYPFQVDSATLRKHAIEGIGEVVRAHPDMTFGIEYKLKEPRTRLFWSTAAMTVLALEQMGADNIGLVIDFGHSLFAKENPAEALSLAYSIGRLADNELCDNYREWDDDLTAGALHVVETFEFLHVTRQIGWEHPLKLDLFPYREDPREAVRESVAAIRALDDRAAGILLDELRAAQANHDAMAAQCIVRTALYG